MALADVLSFAWELFGLNIEENSSWFCRLSYGFKNMLGP